MSSLSHSRRLIASMILGTALTMNLTAQSGDATGSRPPRKILWNNIPEKPLALVTHHELESKAMNRTVGYNVYLPAGYDASAAKRYPVVYFLHGAGGSESSDADGFSGLLKRMTGAGRIPPVICVFPNGGMSAYQDHPDTGINVESMIIGELVPTIDAEYRTLPQRASRVICGFSMGGGGAVRLALVHSELFSSAAALAGAVVNFRTGEIPADLTVEKLSKQEPTVRVLMVTGYDDKATHAGHLPFVELLRAAKYPFTLRTLRGVPHNLGLYYNLAGEEMVSFLLAEVATTASPG